MCNFDKRFGNKLSAGRLHLITSLVPTKPHDCGQSLLRTCGCTHATKPDRREANYIADAAAPWSYLKSAMNTEGLTSPLLSKRLPSIQEASLERSNGGAPQE